MKQQSADYQIVPYPKHRCAEAILYRSVQRTPMIHGLLDVNVTKARTHLREQKATTGESLSFTAFLIACLAKAVDEHKAVQATRFGSKHLILFEEVDVYTPIAREVAGDLHIMPYTIRAANRKTVREIHQEIRAAQVQDVAQASVRYQVFQFLPLLVFRAIWPIFWWIVRRSPQVLKKYRGTVGITAVGMFAHGSGWGIPNPSPTLMVTVGGIGQKPGVVDGQIAIQDYLSLTISFNHELIDGAPTARFTQRLKDLIESGYGLNTSATESQQAVAAGTAK